jgi:DNA-binding NarL/FixJ family response regulator
VVAATEALRTAIAASVAQNGLRIVAAAPTPSELSAADEADVVVIAVDEATDATGWLRAIRAHALAVPVVLVGTFTSPRAVREALDNGADGLVASDTIADTLAPTLEAICRGQIAFPRELRSLVWRPVLSTREKQILGMVVLGFTNGEIARQLVVAESTVKSHLSSAFRKLGVRSRTEASELILDPARGLGTGILTISTNGSDDLETATQ